MKPTLKNISPILDHIFVRDMNFGEQKSSGGIVLRSDDGKSEGVKPRWGKICGLGPKQKSFKIDEWILIEHGRWTRGINVDDDGQEITIWMVDPSGILVAADERPSDLEFGKYSTPEHGSVHSPEDFVRY